LTDTYTSALLVLKAGEIRYEEYWLTGGPNVQWISFSVAKSFVSTLVGIAISDGFISTIEEAISDYVPVPPGSAYDGVRIKDVLQMSSGARWDETYSDPQSEVFRLGAAMGEEGSLLGFVRSMMRATTPGAICHYNSGDTQMLGQLLVAATGRSLTDYMHEKLMEPLAMNAAGYWLIDSTGMEMAFAGVNVIARFRKAGRALSLRRCLAGALDCSGRVGKGVGYTRRAPCKARQRRFAAVWVWLSMVGAGRRTRRVLRRRRVQPVCVRRSVA
jgi:CubicO group peptidase (beta-lactamase class C family)